MTMTADTLRAEWEPHGVVMLAWPHSATDWAYMLDEVQSCYRELIAALLRAGEHVVLLAPASEAPEFDSPEVTVVHCPTNDTWIRDYGPLTRGSRLLDFRFNAWGQKFASNLDNLSTRRLRELGVFAAPVESNEDFVLEGGAIESDGRGTLLTTACCLLAPNRNEPMCREEIEEEILRRLGGRKLLWLEHGGLEGDDTDGHVDTLCRLAPHNTVIYTGAGRPSDPQTPGLRAMAAELREMTDADGRPFNLVELPLPDPVYDPDDGSRLPATYANYLVTERAVLLPTYGQPMNDDLAAQTLRIVFPDREIIPVDCRALVRQHGSLHCATMQVPRSAFSFL